ncbi:MAG: hypothetical protein KDK34_06555, partial [Leptospiraceae bacterium]|nr:hypothetical protein [Leptospiraceae bacterium]
MLKRITLFAMILCLSSFPLMAQDDELPEGSIDVDLAVVSNYVWRGGDIHAVKLAEQKQDEISSNTEAWTFQPSITLNTPVDGLYFNIWGSFAMHNREDQDVDLRIQQGPAGPDVLASGNMNDLIVKYFP